MKKLLFLLMVMVFTVACSKTEPENPTPEPKPENTESITLASGTDSAPVVSSEGGSIIVSFTASTAWSASMINSNADSWCSVSPASGNAGSSNITITIKPNDTPDNRSASVVIKAGTASQTIKIEQKQKDALIITASSFEVPAEGDEIKVVAKSNISFTHNISSDAQSWIKPIKTKAMKDSTLTFEIVANEAMEGRSGNIFLSSGNLKDTVTVFQAGDVPKIIITQKEYVLKSEGESFEVEVASNVNATMRMVYPQGVDAWITENSTKAVSTNKFCFIAQANESYDSRSAFLIFANTENNLADTVTVTQAQKDAIVLAQCEYEFGIAGGKMDFEILANVDVTVTIPDSCSSWIKQVTTRGLESKTLLFDIADAGREYRKGVIILTGGNVSQTISVKQAGVNEALQKEKDALIALYKSTGGNNWANNTNWCSDKPVGEWYGVYVNSKGLVRKIDLGSNNLNGTIPSEIGDFEDLTYLSFFANQLTGTVPESISNLKNLTHIGLHNNSLEGNILDNIKNLQHLNRILLEYNNFTGIVPEELSTMPLIYLGLQYNRFSGELPGKIIEMQLKGEYDEDFRCWLEPQQPGYHFSNPATKEMIDLGSNLYMHPDGIALEYRKGVQDIVLNGEEKTRVTKLVYDKFGDYFDFIAFLYNVENVNEVGGVLSSQIAAGVCYNVSNSVEGIGMKVYSNSNIYGSSGNLKALLDLSTYRTIKSSTFTHEIMHTFGAFYFGQEGMNSGGVNATPSGHWGISSVDGNLGGFKLSSLERNVDGNPNKYRATCSDEESHGRVIFYPQHTSNAYYAPVELYLMGLISIEEVPDIHYFTGTYGSEKENIFKNGIFYAKEEHVLTKDDIISKFGTRKPDYISAQKDFRCLVIVVTNEPVDDRRWIFIEDDMKRMQTAGPSGYRDNINFYEATGGRGTMTFDGLKSLMN